MNDVSSACTSSVSDAAVAAARAAGAGTPPGHGTLVDEAYKLYCNLQESGAAVDAQEFLARYPTIQESLARLIEVHRFLEGHSELVVVDSEVDWPRPGDVFAGFHLEEELGQGAIAHVYRATEPALGHRQVVVKISRRGGSEAATLGRIPHPNIVPVFSVAEERSSGLSGVCMPYLGRATLLNVLDHVFGKQTYPVGPTSRQYQDAADTRRASAILDAIRDPAVSTVPPPVRTLRKSTYVDGVRWLAIQLADALAFIHKNGVLHRDLKPSNILMRPDGTPMLLDFNLAADEQLPATRDGGTPLYMAPEQLEAMARGPSAARKLDARSDVFSFGVIVYELLTGVYPFGPLPDHKTVGGLLQFLPARQRKGIRPIRDLRPEVDKLLAKTVEKCLAHDPAERPQSADVIAHLLRRSNRFVAHAGRWLVRWRKSVIAACLLFGAIGFAGAAHLANRPPEQTVQAERGREAYERRDYALAVHHFSASLQADSRQADILFARGKAYAKLAATDISTYALANADFDHAERLAPSGWNQAYLGYCLQRQRLTNAAIFRYENALKQGIVTAAIHNNLAELYSAKGQFDKAQDHLDEALYLKPNLQVAHYNQAVVYYRKALAATQSAAQQDFVKKGIGHFQQTLDLGRVTGNMMYTGAALCAFGYTFDKDAWIEPTMSYLAKAIELGIKPDKLVNDSSFQMFKNHPRFAGILTLTPPANHPDVTAVRVAELLAE